MCRERRLDFVLMVIENHHSPHKRIKKTTEGVKFKTCYLRDNVLTKNCDKLIDNIMHVETKNPENL